MKIYSAQLVSAILVLFALEAHCTTRYVNLDNPSPVIPYTSWATAATNIQNAIDIASAGDLILVTNGVYNVGEGLVPYAEFSRVAVTRALIYRAGVQ